MSIYKLSDVALDDFIEFKDMDKQGKFSYVGKVIKKDTSSNYFEMQTMHAHRQGFYFKPDGENRNSGKLFKGEKPVGWDKFDKDPDAYYKKQQDKKEEKRQEEQQIKQTTKEQVFALVTNNPDLNSSKLLEKARQDIGGDDKLLSMFIKVAVMHKGRGK